MTWHWWPPLVCVFTCVCTCILPGWTPEWPRAGAPWSPPACCSPSEARRRRRQPPPAVNQTHTHTHGSQHRVGFSLLVTRFSLKHGRHELHGEVDAWWKKMQQTDRKGCLSAKINICILISCLFFRALYSQGSRRRGEEDERRSHRCARRVLFSLSSSFNWEVTAVNWAQRILNEWRTQAWGR